VYFSSCKLLLILVKKCTRVYLIFCLIYIIVYYSSRLLTCWMMCIFLRRLLQFSSVDSTYENLILRHYATVLLFGASPLPPNRISDFFWGGDMRSPYTGFIYLAGRSRPPNNPRRVYLLYCRTM